MSTAIKSIHARQILDSRGNPTVETEVILFSGEHSTASVPSGASTGKFETVELRDNSDTYGGKGVAKAVTIVNNIIAPVLCGEDAENQAFIDNTMIDLDETENKNHLGANAILSVSMACLKVSAAYYKLPLYRYLGGINAVTLPVPMINILNGGVHADNGLEFQEFMICPAGAKTFSQSVQMGSEVFHTLKCILKKQGYSTGVGDEGGFAPKISEITKVLDLIIEAIITAGYSTNQIKICLDAASSEFYNGGKYYINGKGYSNIEFANMIEKLVNNYPIISIEDGMAQEDWEGWEILTKNIGGKCQLVGDDLFVTNIKRIKEGVEKQSANSVLIKPNQIGTVTETLHAINYAKNHGYTTIISHRSGETEDTFIADLAAGIGCKQIKTGSMSRGERIAKYNRLLKIEQELGARAVYAGINAFNIQL